MIVKTVGVTRQIFMRIKPMSLSTLLCAELTADELERFFC